jgi:hypothetical protein
MAREHENGRTDRLNEQLNSLNADLRERGTPPARDLWPDIDQAITAAEDRQVRPARRRRWDWPQIAATAAMVMFLVTTFWWLERRDPESGGPLGPVIELAAVVPETSGLAVIEQALDELNLALAEDPENLSLTNLALMLHQSRGRILRQNADMRLNGG